MTAKISPWSIQQARQRFDKPVARTPRGIFAGVALTLLFSSLAPMGMAQTNQEMVNPKPVPILQTKADLLAGLSRGVAYSGFRHGQHPDRGDGVISPSDTEIVEDLRILGRHSNFGLIRLYDSQANSETTLRLIKANRIPIKVMLGAWLSAELSNPHCPWLKTPIPQEALDANRLRNQKEIESAIRLAQEYSGIVMAVNVGNEAMVDWTDHMVSVESVISYVRHVKRAIRQPVTVADNYAWWTKNGVALAKEVDFITMHSYPEWEGKEIDEALAYTIANVQGVHAALPESRIVIGEAGWATVASEFGWRASEQNQKRYVDELTRWATAHSITTFIFEAFDEDWKGDAADLMGAEKHWGLFTVDRKAKLAMHELYPDLAPAKE